MVFSKKENNRIWCIQHSGILWFLTWTHLQPSQSYKLERRPVSPRLLWKLETPEPGLWAHRPLPFHTGSDQAFISFFCHWQPNRENKWILQWPFSSQVWRKREREGTCVGTYSDMSQSRTASQSHMLTRAASRGDSVILSGLKSFLYCSHTSKI